VLSNISFSGDSEEFVNSKYELSVSSSGNEIVLQQVRKLCDRFISDDVGLVLCQKVVHPEIKEHLRKSCVLVIDRLGRNIAGIAEKLTGAIPINHLHQNDLRESYGYIDDVRILSQCETNYYNLTCEKSLVSTVYLCSPTEEALSELKYVCDVANHVLRMAVTKPIAVPGSGCFDIMIASLIRQKVLDNEDELSETLQCGRFQLQEVIDILLHVLEKIAQLNSGSGNTYPNSNHLWTKSNLTCNCGRFKCLVLGDLIQIPDKGFSKKGNNLLINEFEIVDLKESKVNALLTGISTAALVLRTGTFIQEKI